MLEPYGVAKFSQASAVPRIYPGPADESEMYSVRQARDGICYGLSLNWLSRVKYFRNETPQQRINYMGSEHSIVSSLQAQMYYSNRTHARNAMIETSHVEYDAIDESAYAIGSPIGLGRAFLDRIFISKLVSRDYAARAIRVFDFSTYDTVFKTFVSSRNVEECSQAVTRRLTAPATHHIFAFTMINSAHAVACSMRNGNLLFFDPNYGEAHVPTPDVQNFVTGVMSQYWAKDESIQVELIKLS